VISWLRTRGPQFDEAFARPQVIRTAINKVHVKPAARIAGAHEIAFFPPVTGG
jgi:molybdopterin synthase sulfur carrier subunit